MSDMITRYRGLILSFALMLILSACTEQLQLAQPEPVRLFNREYYAVKNLTRSDVRKMKQLLASEDISAAKTAGTILGRHYVRNGKLAEGYALLQENVDDSYLDRFTKVSGHLWLYDAAKKSEDTLTAEAELEYLRKVEMDAKAVKAFRLYCAQETMIINDEDVKACVTETPEQESESGIEIFEEPRVVDEMSEKAPLVEKIIVKVESAESDPALMEAMLYTTSKLNVDVEFDFTGTRPDYDFTLDVASEIIASKTNIYEFQIDMEKVFTEAANLAMLNGALNLVLGYTPELYEKAIELEEKYKNSDINVYSFNVEDPSFKDTLRTIREQVGENAALSFAVAGSEKQLVKVVPFLRFYSEKPDRTIIVSAVKGFGKLFFNQEYIEYFRGSYVVTEVLLLGNSNVEKYNEDFFEDFSRLPELKDMLGHDLVFFLEKIVNPSFIEDYLTGIKSLEEGRVVRDMEAYKIVASNKVRKLIN